MICTQKANTKGKESIFTLLYSVLKSAVVQYSNWHIMCTSLKVHNVKVHI